MATKNDLIEAQSFSRRRLLTAFVSGAPGGKELAPAAPLRAVIAAVALTAAVVLAGVFYGLIQPGLPSGWQNGKMLVAKDTGGRYVTVNGTLHPVLNTSSARLLIPSSDFGIITTDQKTLDAHKLGATVGIVGAPDELPSTSELINTGWTACATGNSQTDVSITASADAATSSSAAVVESAGIRYIVQGDRRFEVDPSDSDAVLRAAGFTSLNPVAVPASWLNLFTPGTSLTPIYVSNAGLPIAHSSLTIGEVVHIQGSPTTQRFLVQPNGTLAALSPLAWQLLQLGTGRGTGTVVDLSASAIASLQTSSTPEGSADWPSSAFTPLTSTERPCAVLTTRDGATDTVLGAQSTSVVAANGVHVDAGHGALVYAGGSGAQNSHLLTLIDGTGTAYALPGATGETIKRLGYASGDVGTAPQSWVRLFGAGPALTSAAAGQTHSAGAQ